MRDRLVIKNSAISLMCQLLDVVLGFVVRKLFIQYIGIEMAGVNTVFASVLSTLSLAELGFESAVIFSLYQPMHTKDKNTIEEIVAILKRIYEVVGIFILTAGVGVVFFLPRLLKNVEMSPQIYTVYFLQLAGTAVTYFLAYKRTFLLALQKDYIRNIFVSVYKIAATILQIILILRYHSFVLYALVSIGQNFLTNLSIARYVDKNYDYDFRRKKINNNLLSKILSDVREIFVGKLAGYVYSSTDNLIISAVVGPIAVGYLGNYTQILYQIKTVVSNIFNSTKPIIGHFLTDDKDKAHTFQILKDYTFIRFMVSIGLLVPGFVLCDCFITAWLGADKVIGKELSLLLVSDIFIHFVHGALVDYIAGLGYFKQDRKVSIIGAILNLGFSLGLVQVIGISGVLIGTIISQSYFWVSRSVIISRDYFGKDYAALKPYWKICISYIFVFYLLCLVCWFLFSRFPMADSYGKFILGGFMCIAVVFSFAWLIFHRTPEYRYAYELVRKAVKSKMGK